MKRQLILQSYIYHIYLDRSKLKKNAKQIHTHI